MTGRFFLAVLIFVFECSLFSALFCCRLLSGTRAVDDLTVELFGYNFTAQLALRDEMDRLFYTARYG